MYRKMLTLLFIIGCAGALFAQDLSNIQIHGFLTQGFLYSSNNNFFTMKTSDGSVKWNDAAVSINDSVSDKLRIGLQLHVYQFGEFGGPNIQIDWALGDYRAHDWLGFRAGKVKTPFGLYNDSQDVDAVHLWTLLPESIYPTDNKSFTLAHYGADVYGSKAIGKRAGTLTYRGYAGYRTLDLNGGYVVNIEELTGMSFNSAPSGNIFGGDLQWQTPLRGLTVGVSALTSNLNGAGPQGSFHIPYSTTPVYYAKFEKGKFAAAGEFKRAPGLFTANLEAFVFPFRYDSQSWYIMSSYRLTEKLQVGAYYSYYLNRLRSATTPAGNFSKEWVVSGRYDFNSYLYAKMEGHFINGTALGYYGSTNPDGLQPKSNMLAAKVGFSF